MPPKTKKVWVTKYLFTKGLFESDVVNTTFPDMVKNNKMVLHKNDWHETK